MQFQTATDSWAYEAVYRTVQNANTGTGTITAGSIAVGAPLILATATASLPANPSSTASPFLPGSSVRNNFVTLPVTSTSIINNLFCGILAKAPAKDLAGSASGTYLDREQLGLAQCYGPYIGAIMRQETTTNTPGFIMVPELTGFLISVTGPVTAASTGTAANVEVPALGGLAVLMGQIVSSSATQTTTGIVFLRCM